MGKFLVILLWKSKKSFKILRTFQPTFIFVFIDFSITYRIFYLFYFIYYSENAKTISDFLNFLKICFSNKFDTKCDRILEIIKKKVYFSALSTFFKEKKNIF